MNNIERAKIALADVYPEATVQAESYVVNLSPDSSGYGSGTSVITCYAFHIKLKDGRRVVCSEMYIDDFFDEMSIDEIGSYLRERCVATPDDVR